MRYVDRTPQETLTRQLNKADAFDSRVQRAITRLRLKPKRERRVRAITGSGATMADLRLSDVTARKAGAEILFKVVEDLYDGIASPNARLYHLTLFDDLGVTSDRKPHLKIKAIKRKVDKGLRAMGLSALVFIEIQPLLNYPAQGKGRTLLVHAHALCWGIGSKRAFHEAKMKLNRSRSWTCMFGAKPVRSRRLEGIEDMLKIACYVAKLPHDGKYRVPHEDGGWRFRPTLRDYPDRLALRISEGLSHYTIFDAVFGVGQGKRIRSEWKRRLVAWHAERLARVGKGMSFDIDSFWDRVRRSGTRHYALPFKID
jgi:hypothetical protein